MWHMSSKDLPTNPDRKNVFISWSKIQVIALALSCIGVIGGGISEYNGLTGLTPVGQVPQERNRFESKTLELKDQLTSMFRLVASYDTHVTSTDIVKQTIPKDGISIAGDRYFNSQTATSYLLPRSLHYNAERRAVTIGSARLIIPQVVTYVQPDATQISLNIEALLTSNTSEAIKQEFITHLSKALASKDGSHTYTFDWTNQAGQKMKITFVRQSFAGGQSVLLLPLLNSQRPDSHT